MAASERVFMSTVG